MLIVAYVIVVVVRTRQEREFNSTLAGTELMHWDNNDLSNVQLQVSALVVPCVCGGVVILLFYLRRGGQHQSLSTYLRCCNARNTITRELTLF